MLGSNSVLPGHPELGGAGQPLEVSPDADLLLLPVDQVLADLLKDAVGHDSLFEQRHGYYADILRPEIVETLPVGWESRLHPVVGYGNVFALDVYDLALVKLVVGRPKDLELLRALLKLGIMEASRLRAHYSRRRWRNTKRSSRDGICIWSSLNAGERKGERLRPSSSAVLPNCRGVVGGLPPSPDLFPVPSVVGFPRCVASGRRWGS